MQDLFSPYPFVLSEAAICERLRRDESITLHPTLFNTPLIYEPAGARVLAGVYHEYIDIARDYALPIVIAAPTWRLDAERVAEAGEPKTINRDAVAFIQRVKQDSGYEHVFVTGLLACKNDCYDPKVALSADEAEDFHSAQASELADAGLDLLTAQTIPAVSEAEGMARAMMATGLPVVIGFCINRRGEVLDGTLLGEAIDMLDERLDGGPLGYAVNCSHPSFVPAGKMSPQALSRLVEIAANASSIDHGELEQLEQTVEDDLGEWADAMASLHRDHGVKILGGCCGTTDRHLRAICQRLRGD
ncbi:MAG: homocysteine S-methyltransferase family protein [Akkermansiaceae bacterium]